MKMNGKNGNITLELKLSGKPKQIRKVVGGLVERLPAVRESIKMGVKDIRGASKPEREMVRERIKQGISQARSGRKTVRKAVRSAVRSRRTMSRSKPKSRSKKRRKR